MAHQKDARWILVILIWIGSVSFANSALAQQAQYLIYEEIQSLPETAQGKKPTGTWKVGGYDFIVEEQTKIDSKHSAEKGRMVAIEFYIVGDRKIATGIVPMPEKVADVVDGPYVFWKDKTTAEIVLLQNGKKVVKTYRDIKEPREIKDLPGEVSSIILDPAPPEPIKADWDAPSRLMAISDLEGNYENALQFLTNNGVVDKNGDWAWKDGHLVLIGDLVDRGDQVMELMWLLHKLERQAKKAGGQLHYVLGNHEAMVMGADVRYIHMKYRFVCGRLKMRYHDLFGPDTEIGRWWRSKNAVIRIGDLLFVHGGYSPVLDEAKLDMNTLNRRVRAGIYPNQPLGQTAATNPVRHQHGPFWYRGYFDRFAAEWGGKATEAQVKKILDRHGAKHVVIGHTLVEQVGALDDTGQVIAIDVKWKDKKKCQGLLYEKGKLWRVTMDAKKERLTPGK